MRILVNHLTRMSPGYICVAGIDEETKKHVRPVLPYRRQLGTNLLWRNGGPFGLAAVVDLGPTQYVGSAPEFEDYAFEPDRASCLGEVPADYFWDRLCEASCKNPVEIFGQDLDRSGRSYTVDVGGGQASLGCLRATRNPDLYVNEYGKVRLHLAHLPTPADLSVTDLRLYQDDHENPHRSLISDVQECIKSGVGTILSVGLTRPFRKRNDTVKRHWLQINNIHLEDDPGWR